jgi:hypothetical protein
VALPVSQYGYGYDHETDEAPRLVEEPGPEAKTHRHSNASTDDFAAHVEKESGKELTELWDSRLYGEDKPAAVQRLSGYL